MRRPVLPIRTLGKVTTTFRHVLVAVRSVLVSPHHQVVQEVLVLLSCQCRVVLLLRATSSSQVTVYHHHVVLLSPIVLVAWQEAGRVHHQVVPRLLVTRGRVKVTSMIMPCVAKLCRLTTKMWWQGVMVLLVRQEVLVRQLVLLVARARTRV